MIEIGCILTIYKCCLFYKSQHSNCFSEVPLENLSVKYLPFSVSCFSFLALAVVVYSPIFTPCLDLCLYCNSTILSFLPP